MVPYILVAIIAYLIGSVNFSILISKKYAGFDLRDKGSGNAGTTNTLRTVGKKAALATLILDILKGLVAVGIAVLVGKIFKNIKYPAMLVQMAGILVIIGHTFPIFFGFRGGKGIATSLGVLLLTNWQVGLICLTFAIVLIILTKMVSVGSISAAILFPILTLYIGNNHFIVPGKTLSYMVYSIAMAIIVMYNHRTNIKRILSGTENKISFKK